MIKVLEKQALDEAVDFAWKLCDKMETRSYTLFENREAMEHKFQWSLEQDEWELIACYHDNVLKGVASYFLIPRDSYAQTTGFYVHDEHAAHEILDFLEHKLAQYSMHIGIPAENTMAASALESRGYSVEERSYDMRCDMQDFNPASPKHNIVRVDEDLFPQYAEFHDRHFRDFYWNSARLAEQLEDWYIFVALEGSQITGSIFCRLSGSEDGEIFGAYATTPEMATGLITSAMSQLLEVCPSIARVVYFTEEHERVEREAARALGFVEYSQYRLWKKDLSCKN